MRQKAHKGWAREVSDDEYIEVMMAASAISCILSHRSSSPHACSLKERETGAYPSRGVLRTPRLEIQMIMLPTAGIETSLTRRTDRMTLEVLRYRQGCAAGTTQNSFLGKRTAWPHLGRMLSCSFMTLVTSVVHLTAFEFDGDTIQLAVVMGTAGLCV